MPLQVKSSEVQQNFGRVVDQALVEDDVIIERYGEPRAVILGYQRYQQLLAAEEALAGINLAQPDRTEQAREQGRALAETVRRELEGAPGDSLDETMRSLRGRS